MINISIVIPCYNEEKILPESIERLEKFFYQHRDRFVYELIFVDDGSTDNTYEILCSYIHHGKNIRVEAYKYNIGKGYAIKQGLMLAQYNTILILDADLSVRPEELLPISMSHDLESDDTFIVCGIRKYAVPQTKMRILLGKGFSLLHRIWLNVGIWDSQCPMKILHNVSDEFVSELKIEGFAYDLELLYRAKKQNITVNPFKTLYYNVSDSRVTVLKTIRMFWDMLKIRFIQ